MDNARIHHGEEIRELAEQHGASNSIIILDSLTVSPKVCGLNIYPHTPLI